MQGVPKTKLQEINDLFGKFTDAYADDLKINDILYIRLKNSLEDCIKRGGGELGLAYAYLANLYTYKFDRSKFEYYIRSAEAVMGRHDDDWAHNCIAGAANLGMFDRAREVLDNAKYEDPWWLNYKINLYFSMGLVDSALQCWQRLKRMESKDNQLLEHSIALKNAQKASAILESVAISQDLIFEMIKACAQVVGEATNKPLAKYSLAANFESGILYTFIVDEPIDKMVELEWQLSECLVDSFDEDMSGVFSASVSYLRD
ncbi:hypothetical protein H4C48_13225 [Pseudomonas asiatica]|uniref:hypothetical protein n=1 Tax=Pseudomonas asiatica TaxID=2219225 RepID=UPI0015F8F1DA|nr:hypothetical protein [Pseudomonas asiatica]MBA6111317.1 hypothetical protein [Pseudomonas asiatica]